MSDNSTAIPTRFVDGPGLREDANIGAKSIYWLSVISGKNFLTSSPSVAISLNDRNDGEIVQNVSEVLHVVDPDSTHSQASICPQE